jgi:hypothetical protein
MRIDVQNEIEYQSGRGLNPGGSTGSAAEAKDSTGKGMYEQGLLWFLE